MVWTWLARRGNRAAPRFPQPPQTRNHEGRERRVGVELEFIGLGIERIGTLVRDTLGGEIQPHTPYEYTIAGTRLGDFRVELDYAYLKKLGRRELGDDAAGDLERLSEDVLATVAKRVVPFEIVSPPIPMSRLGELEALVAALRDAGARGTADSPIYAFGLHLNPELPGLEAGPILAYLRAYAVLADWLRRVSNVDISRRIFPYIQPWPKEYKRLLVDPAYAPDVPALVADYLAHNATRNRAMDLLPLCAHLAPDRVAEAVDDDRVAARPTLHYRLPNCEIERPGWRLAEPWSHWLAVERLAADPERLAQACDAYREHLDSALAGLIEDWARKAEAWA